MLVFTLYNLSFPEVNEEGRLLDLHTVTHLSVEVTFFASFNEYA